MKDINTKAFNNLKGKSIGEIFKYNVRSRYKLLNLDIYNKINLIKNNSSGISSVDESYHNKIKKVICTDFIGSPFFNIN